MYTRIYIETSKMQIILVNRKCVIQWYQMTLIGHAHVYVCVSCKMKGDVYMFCSVTGQICLRGNCLKSCDLRGMVLATGRHRQVMVAVMMMMVMVVVLTVIMTVMIKMVHILPNLLLTSSRKITWSWILLSDVEFLII